MPRVSGAPPGVEPGASAAYASLLPASVVCFELREPGDAASLLPEEAAHMGRAVPSRVAEFAAGRLCARHALRACGVDGFALRVATDRQPIWPAGLIGSITHTAGLCVAAVARRGALVGVGIDSELIARASPEFLPRIGVASEIAWVRSLPPAEQAAAILLLFSAKEAFYKSQYPLTAEWLDFSDVRVALDAWRPPAGATAGGFEIQPMRPVKVAGQAALPIRGKYRFHEEFVSAAVVLHAMDGPLVE
jgi:4'-phosphopantetheinyl transferase EntD